tara:strand:+ start:2949 stop:3953 length:1005 start_codon:yes stop_codon:yes gene_type:complete
MNFGRWITKKHSWWLRLLLLLALVALLAVLYLSLSPWSTSVQQIDAISGLAHKSSLDEAIPIPAERKASTKNNIDEKSESATLDFEPQVEETFGQTSHQAIGEDSPVAHKPLIAIVIDDLGLNESNTEAAIALPSYVTLSFLPYSRSLSVHTSSARAAGHELLAHIPMEPMSSVFDPGPNALLTSHEESEITKRLRWHLAQFSGYVGVNNHMGSRFTAWAIGMRAVMGELKKRDLFFLDSRTTAATIGKPVAHEIGVPYLYRNVFLDNDPDPDAIAQQLLLTEEIAKNNGFVVAIGHPKKVTLNALKTWLPSLSDRGFNPVSLTHVLEYETSRR